MNPVQEAKQELEASIRYAENAIVKANQTIESMGTYQEQTGREEALAKQVHELEREVQRQQDLGQGYYDSMMTFKQQLEEAKTNMALMTDERDMLEGNVKYLRDENERLKRQKEASSGPCGCQAYRDLEAQVNALEQPEKPTMPVIPKAVAIAIFREGMAYGGSRVCDELDNATDIEINETGYTGGFEVSFSQYIDLSDHLDLDFLRNYAGDYDEESIIEALNTMCAEENFECRIHGVDDQEEKKND